MEEVISLEKVFQFREGVRFLILMKFLLSLIRRMPLYIIWVQAVRSFQQIWMEKKILVG